MVVQESSGLVYDYRLSSVGPGRASGPGLVHNPGGVDLAMKLHYVRGVYFLESQAIKGMSNLQIKGSMFYWLNEYFHTCGRFRRSDLGRPYVKCNDCGVRIIEARCDKTVAEWLEMEDWQSHQMLLIPQQIIGPEISFSPPVFFQVTRFKCGGIALGIGFAHVLGDAFSVADYINRWAQIATSVHSNGPPKTTAPIPLHNTKLQNLEIPKSPPKELAHSLKRVDPVGDHWIFTTDSKMGTFSFQVTPPQITHLKNKIPGPFFESLCAMIWHSIAKVRQQCEPKNVTLVKRNPKRIKGVVENGQIISTVEANFSPKEADHNKLATLLAEQASNVTAEIEDAVEIDRGVSDFIVYGTNLTFVDWQEANFYEFELQGCKPELVWYNIQGVGDNGVVFVLPGSNVCGTFDEKGRSVTIVLPLDEVSELKCELKKNGLLLENTIE